MSSGTPREHDGADDATVSIEQRTERDPPAPQPAPAPAPGSRVGRYEVMGVLGSGGMGVVVKARDPHLGREVAIKVLRAQGGVGSAAGVRLLREAQALAQLAHPNVVAVHDVGVHDGAIFLAMELVQGQTLREWVAAATRSWRAILAVFVEAGRGLAAAHRAGLVHRDVKPSNVVVAADGRPRVLDFGLARSGGDASGDTLASGSGLDLASEVTGPLLGSPLTVAGAVVGTPRYMALEQHDGDAVDARADQFSFCVALFEALYGTHPFPPLARNRAAMRAAIVDGPIAAPRGSRVPRHVDRALRRGLAADAADRFPTMDALLAALTRDRWRPWRRAGLAAVIAGLAAAAVIARQPAADRRCQGGAERVAAVWSPAVKDRLRGAMLATGRGHAADTFARVARGLDELGASWVVARREVCEATELRREQSPAVMDQRMACLDRRLARTDTQIRIWLDDRSGDSLEHAVVATGELADLGACAGAAAAIGLPARGTPARVAAEQVLAAVDRAEALESSGQVAAAAATARGAAAVAGGLGPGVELAATLRLGLALEARGDHAESQRVLEAALAQAAAAGDDAAMARAWLGLMSVTARWQARYQDAVAMRPMAEALVTRSGTPTGLRLALLRELVSIHNELGEYGRARALLDEELVLVRAAHGERDPRYAEALRALGHTLTYQGDYTAGRGHLEQARDLLVASLGPQHPAVATALNNLATCLSYQGEFGTALDVYRQVLAIREATVGREHGLYVRALHNVGSSLFDLEHFAEAKATLETALAIGERVYGKDHLELSWTLRDLGGTAANSGDPVTGMRYLERALVIRERALGKDHPEVAWVLDMLGQVACEAGRFDAGVRHLERARAIFMHSVGTGHERVAAATAGIAHCQRRAGDPRTAIGSYERALASFQADTGAAISDGRLASYRFGLVQALWDTGQRSRALVMAREIRAVLERDAGQKLLQAEVVAWLATRGG
jgi:tetratricopeptide (TPR) repeat protein/predicted Ser/Thr protein kinase